MTIRGVLAIAVLLSLAGCSVAAEAPSLRLYVPQSVEVEGADLTLGAIGVLSGDEQLVRAASPVPMGRAPWRKERITIDRNTILSRLASSGIVTGEVQITGADKVTIRRKETVFSPPMILAAAQEALQAKRPLQGNSAWRLVRQPDEMVVDGGNARLRVELAGEAGAQEAKATVAACDGPKDLATRELVFRQTRPMQQAVASKDIPIGGAITADNIRIETVVSDQPVDAGWAPPYGMIARKHLPAGTVIASSSVSAPQPQVVIKRDQIVAMRLEGLGFRLSTVAQALQDGRCGDCIRVMNIDSKRVVTVRVTQDGSVRPIVNEENN
jgi:flagella basal body P-ring formation protein FlgA